MNHVATVEEHAIEARAKILCVDDEQNILSSLRRLFRMHGYDVHTAESGREALQFMEAEPVDLVISDMRMPEMDGVQFLEKVRANWPDTIRLLLTGYSDIRSIHGAINRGEIYRYITKPWDDNDIVLVVRHAVERHALEQEKRHLEALSLRQNEELRLLNASLEEKVKERTGELTKAHDQLVDANRKLKSSFLTSIKVFSSIIETRGGNLAGHSRRTADLARKIATRMGLDSHEIQDVFVAGLLHDIGKIAFSDELLDNPVSRMSREQLDQYRKHPIRAQQLLMPLEDLRGTALILRSQLERFDGQGFPDGLSGFNIPLGARIVALASDYDNLLAGTLTQRRMRPDEATRAVLNAGGSRYDPQVVAAFQEVISGRSESRRDIEIRAGDLEPGMILSRDLITEDGFLLLSAESHLNSRAIQQIRDFEVSSAHRLTVHVFSDRRDE